MYKTSLSVAPDRPFGLEPAECVNSPIQPRLTLATTVCFLPGRSEPVSVRVTNVPTSPPKQPSPQPHIDNKRLMTQGMRLVQSLRKFKFKRFTSSSTDERSSKTRNVREEKNTPFPLPPPPSYPSNQLNSVDVCMNNIYAICLLALNIKSNRLLNS
jgi:hypothetical protein